MPLAVEQERSYGPGKPMEMIMAPGRNAKKEGQRVWEKGKPTDVRDIFISPEQEIGVEEAVRNNFAFVQLAGMRAGDSSMVANLSTPLSWDRQTPMEDCAQEIVERIGGSEARLVWFGPHKLVGFLKGQDRPEDKLVSLVDAPRQAYSRHLPRLARAQNEIQDRRVEEILDSPNGNGRKFLDIFNGEENLDRAYQDDIKYSFIWGTQKINDMLIATNLDNKLQTLVELATDEDTRQMIETMQNFFTGTDFQNRYFIIFDFSQTASCANISSNAQHGESHVWESDALSIFSSGLQTDILKYPNGENYFDNKTCDSCGEKEESCICKKDNEEKEE